MQPLPNSLTALPARGNLPRPADRAARRPLSGSSAPPVSASRPCADAATRRLMLYHHHDTALHEAIRDAAPAVALHTCATRHTLRLSFTTRLRRTSAPSARSRPCSVTSTPALLIHAHIVDPGSPGVVSPLRPLTPFARPPPSPRRSSRRRLRPTAPACARRG